MLKSCGDRIQLFTVAAARHAGCIADHDYLRDFRVSLAQMKDDQVPQTPNILLRIFAAVTFSPKGQANLDRSGSER